jgi:hypothetical protein
MGTRAYDFMQSMDKLVKQHPELLDNEMDKHDMTREERMMHSWKRIHRLMELKPEIFTEFDQQYWCNWQYYWNDIASPIYQHQMMFVMCIDFLGSPEQRE